MPSSPRRDQIREQARNFFLVLLAVGLVILFFNLDVLRGGESLFRKTSTARLRFTGRLDRKAYAPDEIARLVAFLRRYDADIAVLTVWTATQDSYGAVDGDTPILFVLRLDMADGATIDTPVRRVRRARLLPAVLAKLHKDMKTYRALKREGRDVDTLINVM